MPAFWPNGFVQKQALGQPILTQNAKGSKWVILLQNGRPIRQIGGFRGPPVNLRGLFGPRTNFGVQSNEHLMAHFSPKCLGLKMDNSTAKLALFHC